MAARKQTSYSFTGAKEGIGPSTVGAHNNQDWLEARLIERLLIERQSPYEALKDMLALPEPPDPLELVFALTTVAADLSGWHEPDLQALSDRCFEEAALFVCELWAEGYRLHRPEP